MRPALIISIWQLSATVYLSSSVSLDWADAHFQVSPKIFDRVRVQAVAVSLKDIHRVVYKPLLLCASGHCPVGSRTFSPSEDLNAPDWVFIKANFDALSFSSTQSPLLKNSTTA